MWSRQSNRDLAQTLCLRSHEKRKSTHSGAPGWIEDSSPRSCREGELEHMPDCRLGTLPLCLGRLATPYSGNMLTNRGTRGDRVLDLWRLSSLFGGTHIYRVLSRGVFCKKMFCCVEFREHLMGVNSSPCGD